MKFIPFFLIFFSPLFLAVSLEEALLPSRFTVEESSKLYMLGSTNVNTFRCDCQEQFSTYSMKMEEKENGQKVIFSNTKLLIPSTRFDCGNKMMNRDMVKTLKGEKYPNIQIELIDAVQVSGKKMGECADWVNMKATAAITIAGIRKVVSMDVMGKKISQGQFHFKGNKDIQLSDFSLVPPSPMMGLVQVNNTIAIHLDLKIKVV